jgi:signal transduction histidine kinase
MTTPSSPAGAQAPWNVDELLAALELSENGFMLFDDATRCVAMNAWAAIVLRRPPESWIGRTIAEVAPEAIGTPFEQAFQRCRREGGLVMIEREYYPPHDRWYQSRFLRAEGGGVIVCFRDVTAQVRLEELQVGLRFEAECRERFEGILAHDLRNPLTTITYAAATLVHAAELTEIQAKSIRRIASSAARAARLIDSLLDLTRARGGGEIPIALQPADLRGICHHAVEEAELSNPNRRVDLVIEGDTGGVWDPDRLAQVLANLLGNALDYSPPGTPVTVTVRAEAEAEAERIVFEVHNHGAPISAEKMAEIFMPFRRGEQATIDGRPGGLGLGLFITKLVVEAHGGSIQVASAPAVGTTFTVSLPRVAGERAKPATT